jgi:hypothetical protein
MSRAWARELVFGCAGLAGARTALGKAAAAPISTKRSDRAELAPLGGVSSEPKTISGIDEKRQFQSDAEMRRAHTHTQAGPSGAASSSHRTARLADTVAPPSPVDVV